MASLEELLAEDGFKKGETKPRIKGLPASRAMSMPLHHGRGTDLPSPFANPRLAKGKVISSESHLPRRKSPAVRCGEDIHEIQGFGGGNLDALHSRRPPSLEAAGVEPRLDEAATGALISILSDYIKCFFKDENSRMLLRQKCCYCLRFSERGEEGDQNDGVIAKLRDAMATIERSAQEFPDPRELKRSSVHLSIIIASLSSSDLVGGFASAMPNSRLSACAHLYLSVIRKLQKKDRASAKHLLQVFCNSPFEARTILLSDLWESLLLPHLHHLKAWYAKEVVGVSDTLCRQTQMKLLERVYSDALDKGTYQIAVYYKEWVMGGKEGPNYPSICIPSTSTSFFVTTQEANPQVLASPSSSVSSRPLISRKLYESIFDRSRGNDVTSEQEDGEEWGCVCGSSSGGGDVEDDETGYDTSGWMLHKEEHMHEIRPVCSSSMHAPVCPSATKSAEPMLEGKASNMESLRLVWKMY